jgi:hypothetical protein
MKYLIGSGITLISIYFALRFLKNDSEKKDKQIMYTQSYMFEIIKPLLPFANISNKKKVVSQSYLHEEKTRVRVIIMDNQAYWIKNNMFYTADVHENSIEKETARVVDTMNMDKVQLDKMLFIMDQLRDGEENDSGSTGN